MLQRRVAKHSYKLGKLILDFTTSGGHDSHVIGGLGASSRARPATQEGVRGQSCLDAQANGLDPEHQDLGKMLNLCTSLS